ncbi:MAG: DUF523 domain-containing protein [Peptoniphilaceae bacterium]|uniref:DUF523 domain-containing protein n=1 Tax=Aedoeadaptatus acetigenes TaxID=2981723 RepID=UPI0011DCB3B8|nr:DUF523 domain-containing protein [Aedoeadaptatus acetigenes]MBS6525874.1 DUF523 domain-containing protein [Peptoniphilaceae bacterium]MCU6787414.1 DUF523 domain-containing protein [Aedoeadaptatus acetigenes]
MIIGVSACLLGENCKYNGGNNESKKLKDYVEGHTVVPVCPEVMGGLPTPRDPAEIIGGVVRQKSGRSVDEEFRAGARAALKKIKDAGAELAILQSRSPSCGVKEIYDGTFTGHLVKGKGVFAAMLEEEGIRALDVEDL